MHDFSLVHTTYDKRDEDVVIYVNTYTIINHKIWKMRNDMKYNDGCFSIKKLYNTIVKSVCSRKCIEIRNDKIVKVKRIKNLYSALLTLKNIMFYNQYQINNR